MKYPRFGEDDGGGSDKIQIWLAQTSKLEVAKILNSNLMCGHISTKLLSDLSDFQLGMIWSRHLRTFDAGQV